MNIKRDKRDIIFSLLVRTRANWRCERCGKQFERGAQNLHCSHLFGRRHRATRWHPHGAVAHCAACHFYLTEHPLVFADWIERHLGDRMLQMYRLSEHVAKFSKTDLESIYKHMKAEHARMTEWKKTGTSRYFDLATAPEIAALEDLIKGATKPKAHADIEWGV